jgi:hypothetical protein
MMERIKTILIAILILLVVFVSMPKPRPMLPIPDAGYERMVSMLHALNPTMTAYAQTAPASAVPATPSSLIGAAFTSYGTKTDNTAQSMQIYKAAGNVSVSSTGLNTMYVYWAACLNTSATAVGALLKDGTATFGIVGCPASAASMGTMSFNPPVRITPGVTPTMTATTGETTLYYMMGGYMDQR